MPIFRSRAIKLMPNKFPNGIQTKTITDGTTAKNGASHQTGLSTPSGVIFSFKRSFMTSATDWSTPCQPTRIGPYLVWIWADTLRSHHIRNIAETAINPRTTAPTTIITIKVRIETITCLCLP